MREARPVAGGRGGARAITQTGPDACHRLVPRRARGDEPGGQVGVRSPPARCSRRRSAMSGWSARTAVRSRSSAPRARPWRGRHASAFGLLDVGLVERVDAQHDAGDRGGDLPTDELPADIDRVGDRDADDRMAGGGKASASAFRPPSAPPSSARRTKTRSSPYDSGSPAARGRPARCRRRACRCSRRGAARPTPRTTSRRR